MNQNPTLITAEPAHAEQLAEVIAAAFHPLEPCAWLVPHPLQRRETLPGYFRILVDHAFTGGLVHTTEQLDAVALWLPVGTDGPTAPQNYETRLKQAAGPHLERFEQLDAQFEAHHLTGVAHHHLAILAVHPDRQGHGLGRALLTAHHRLLDSEGITAYLEASDATNRAWYTRHGYTDHGTAIELPDGPEMFPMVRTPQTSRGDERGALR